MYLFASIAVSVLVVVLGAVSWAIWKHHQIQTAQDIKNEIGKWHLSTMDNMIDKLETIKRYSSRSFVTGEGQFINVIKEYKSKADAHVQTQLNQAGLMSDLEDQVYDYNDDYGNDIIIRVLNYFIADQAMVDKIVRKVAA